MDSWWLDGLFDVPQQGDILSMLPLSRSLFPVRVIEKRSLKGGQAWQETNLPPAIAGEHHALAKGKHVHAIILSHDCHMDKPNRTLRVQLAPVVPMSSLSEADRQTTVAQRTHKRLPLQAIPGIGDQYADLQSMIAIDHAVLGSCLRIASMTPAGIARVQMQLISFYTRKDFSQFIEALPDLPPDDSGPEAAV